SFHSRRSFSQTVDFFLLTRAHKTRSLCFNKIAVEPASSQTAAIASNAFMIRKLLILAAFFALATTPLRAQTKPQPQPPAKMQSAYGQKMQLEGINNAGKVSGSLYRGAQPQMQSIKELKALGITTIVDLRAEDSVVREHEKREAESLGLRFVSIPLSG